MKKKRCFLDAESLSVLKALAFIVLSLALITWILDL